MWFWTRRKRIDSPGQQNFVRNPMDELKEKTTEGRDDGKRLLDASLSPSSAPSTPLKEGLKQDTRTGLEGYISRMEKANDIVFDEVSKPKDTTTEDGILRPLDSLAIGDVPQQQLTNRTLETSPSSRVCAWSSIPHVMLPPLMLELPDALTHSPAQARAMRSPFPRYGHAVAATPSPNGEFILFGGLVEESVLRNDVYGLHPHQGKMQIRRLQATGNIPKPRTGSKAVLRGNVLIIWGGDTRQESDLQDESFVEDIGLYMFNLGPRTWSRIKTSGPTPVGRCGHALALVDAALYVFGGRAGDTYLGDLWGFQLLSLKTSPQWVLLKPSRNHLGHPEPRTGHSFVVHGETIIMFGGQDREYHYNDTWALDTSTLKWSELNCVGSIPVPREGHSATIIDDMMYIFGGRGVDGHDLADVAALRLTDRRWFRTRQLGKGPFARSGHAMIAENTNIHILGGDSFPPSREEDWSDSYVLNTDYIIYPDKAIHSL